MVNKESDGILTGYRVLDLTDEQIAKVQAMPDPNDRLGQLNYFIGLRMLPRDVKGKARKYLDAARKIFKEEIANGKMDEEGWLYLPKPAVSKEEFADLKEAATNPLP